MPVVAQSSAAVSSLWMWVGILIVVVLIGAVVIFAVRRRLLGDTARGAAMDGSLLEQIERMRDQGELSDEEFRRARDRILDRGPRGGADAGSEPASENAPGGASGNERDAGR